MNKFTLIVLTIILLLLAACGKAPQEDLSLTQTFESALQTAVQETLVAEVIAQETNAFIETPDPLAVEEPTPTFTQEPPTPEPTQPPAEPTTSPEPTDAPATPCYRAEMISETIPDGTVFTPGTIFTKIWVIRNTGVCEWNEKYLWKFVEGEDFGVRNEIELGRVIGPGEDLEVKLEMKTPLLEGNYKGTFQIITDEGGSVTPLGFWVYVVSQK